MGRVIVADFERFAISNQQLRAKKSGASHELPEAASFAGFEGYA